MDWLVKVRNLFYHAMTGYSLLSFCFEFCFDYDIFVVLFVMVAKFTKCCRKNTYDILEVRLTGLSKNISRPLLCRHFEELCCPPSPWDFSTFYPFSLWEREKERKILSQPVRIKI
jgi:hypothetical protein